MLFGEALAIARRHDKLEVDVAADLHTATDSGRRIRRTHRDDVRADVRQAGVNKLSVLISLAREFAGQVGAVNIDLRAGGGDLRAVGLLDKHMAPKLANLS